LFNLYVDKITHLTKTLDINREKLKKALKELEAESAL